MKKIDSSDLLVLAGIRDALQKALAMRPKIRGLKKAEADLFALLRRLQASPDLSSLALAFDQLTHDVEDLGKRTSY